VRPTAAAECRLPTPGGGEFDGSGEGNDRAGLTVDLKITARRQPQWQSYLPSTERRSCGRGWGRTCRPCSSSEISALHSDRRGLQYSGNAGNGVQAHAAAASPAVAVDAEAAASDAHFLQLAVYFVLRGCVTIAPKQKKNNVK
jgi:hypothetical protein